MSALRRFHLFSAPLERRRRRETRKELMGRESEFTSEREITRRCNEISSARRLNCFPRKCQIESNRRINPSFLFFPESINRYEFKMLHRIASPRKIRVNPEVTRLLAQVVTTRAL